MKKQQVEESRLDRIERNLEKLIQGTLELKESQKKTDEQLQKTDEQLNKTIEKLDEIGRQLGDLGIVQGQVAEDLFYRNVRYLFIFCLYWCLFVRSSGKGIETERKGIGHGQNRWDIKKDG